MRVESSTTCVFERNTMFKGGMGGKEGVGGGQAGVRRHGLRSNGSVVEAMLTVEGKGLAPRVAAPAKMVHDTSSRRRPRVHRPLWISNNQVSFWLLLYCHHASLISDLAVAMSRSFF